MREPNLFSSVVPAVLLHCKETNSDVDNEIKLANDLPKVKS